MREVEPKTGRFSHQGGAAALARPLTLIFYVIENKGTFFPSAAQHIFVTFGSNKPDHHPKLRI
jgi:hypothetical protein